MPHKQICMSLNFVECLAHDSEPPGGTTFMSGDAYEAMKREDRAGIAAVARKQTQKQDMEVSVLIFQ